MPTLSEHNESILYQINRRMRAEVSCDECRHELWLYPNDNQLITGYKQVICNNHRCTRYGIIERMLIDDGTGT